MNLPIGSDEPLRIVASNGSADETLVGALGLGPDALRELYRLLRLTRSADREAAALQRQGQLAVYGPGWARRPHR